MLTAALPLMAQKGQPSLADLQKSAAAGDAKAQARLGIMYYEGSGGVKQDNKTASSWLLKAAAQNNTQAQYHLGMMYKDRGRNIRAKYWLERCVLSGRPPCVGDAYAKLSLTITADDVEKDLGWLKKKADEENDDTAQQILGVFYCERVRMRDIETSFYYFQKSAQLGNRFGQFNLAQYYANRVGDKCPSPEVDPEKAFYWYGKAAQQDHLMAQFNLGVCYSNAEGTPRDNRAGYIWIKRAADRGLPLAIEALKSPQFAQYIKDEK